MRSTGVQLHAAGFLTLATAIQELSFTDLIDIDHIVADDADIPEVVVQPELPKAIEQLTRYVPSSNMIRPAEQKQSKSAKTNGSKSQTHVPNLPRISNAKHSQEEDDDGSDSDVIIKPSGPAQVSGKLHKHQGAPDPRVAELISNLQNSPLSEKGKKRKRGASTASQDISDDKDLELDQTVIFVSHLSRVLANHFP